MHARRREGSCSLSRREESNRVNTYASIGSCRQSCGDLSMALSNFRMHAVMASLKSCDGHERVWVGRLDALPQSCVVCWKTSSPNGSSNR